MFGETKAVGTRPRVVRAPSAGNDEQAVTDGLQQADAPGRRRLQSPSTAPLLPLSPASAFNSLALSLSVREGKGKKKRRGSHGFPPSSSLFLTLLRSDTNCQILRKVPGLSPFSGWSGFGNFLSAPLLFSPLLVHPRAEERSR